LKALIAKTPSGPERESALEQLREREKALTSVQHRETALYQRLFSGEELLAEATTQVSKKQAYKEIIEALVRWITNQGYRISHGKPRVSTSIKTPGRASVTIPVSVVLTSEVRVRLAQVTQQLEGSTEALMESTRGATCRKDANQKSLARVFPLILAQDSELQELFSGLVNGQVLEISARKADGTVIFERSQALMPQRVISLLCPTGTQGETVAKRGYYLQSAPTTSKPLTAPNPRNFIAGSKISFPEGVLEISQMPTFLRTLTQRSRTSGEPALNYPLSR
jgi:hypothetical protein